MIKPIVVPRIRPQSSLMQNHKKLFSGRPPMNPGHSSTKSKVTEEQIKSTVNNIQRMIKNAPKNVSKNYLQPTPSHPEY